MKMINKNIFLEGRTCHTKGWYLRSRSIQEPLTQAEEFRINEGIEIGKMAHSLYKEGTLVNEGSNIKNHEKTKQLINDPNVQVIYEATFIHNDNIAKADILERIDGAWHLIEVKSSSASENIKEELIDDLAYTTLILSLCGLELKKMSLLLVSKNYRLGMDIEDFFVEINFTDKVNLKRLELINNIDEISKTTGMINRPEPKLIFQCRKCDFYRNDCLGKNVDDPIFDLPNLQEKRFNGFIENKIFLVSQIPSVDDLSPTQKPIWIAVKNKKPSINKEYLRELLGKIVFPAYYLDFESTSTAIPLFPDIGPYQEIVTQYSIHKFSTLSSDEEHFEFLADHTKDDHRALAVKLLTNIGKDGSVIVYHAPAEKRFINNLAKEVPELSNDLNSIINRIVDLEVIIKEAYYHPLFHGSYSIKVVLPVLVPEMSYKNLIIGDGQSASVAFAELARGKYPANKAESLCKELMNYCRQDTLAMVKIHKELTSLCN